MLLPELFGNAPGQADHIGLGGVVARHIGTTRQQACRGGHVQHRAKALGLHFLHRELAQLVHGQHVDFGHGELGLGAGLQKTAADAKARVVDKNVDPLLGQLFTQASTLALPGKVGGEDAAERVVLCQQLGGQLIQPLPAAGGEDEAEAELGIPAGKLPADAGRGSGDPDSLVRHGDTPFLRFFLLYHKAGQNKSDAEASLLQGGHAFTVLAAKAFAGFIRRMQTPLKTREPTMYTKKNRGRLAAKVSASMQATVR